MKKLVGDTILISAAELLNRCKGILFIPIIVGAVGFEGYGAFVQIFITAKLIASLSRLEVGMGFERFASALEVGDTPNLSKHFWSVLLPAMGLASLGALVMYASAGGISGLFFEGGYRRSLEVASLIVLSNTCFAATRSFIISRRRFAHQSAFTVAYNLLPYVGFVVAAAITKDVFTGVLTYAVLDVVAALITLAYVIPRLRWALPSPALFFSYLRYSTPLALSTIQGGLLDKADRYFISGYLGLTAVAVYNIIYRCTELVGFLSIPFKTQMLPYLSAAWDKRRIEESKAIIRNALLLFLGITVGVLLCLTMYFDALLPLISDEHLDVPHLRLIVAAIGLAMLANALKRFYYLYIRLERTTYDESLYQLAGLAVNIVGNVLLIPPFGILGAAISTLLSYGLMIPLISRKYALGIDLPFARHVLSFALLSLAAVPLRFVIPPTGFATLLLSSGAAYASYLAVVLIFKRRLLGNLRQSFERWQRSV